MVKATAAASSLRARGRAGPAGPAVDAEAALVRAQLAPLAAGTPEQVAAVAESHTGAYLRRLVEPAAPRKARRRRVPAAA